MDRLDEALHDVHHKLAVGGDQLASSREYRGRVRTDLYNKQILVDHFKGKRSADDPKVQREFQLLRQQAEIDWKEMYAGKNTQATSENIAEDYINNAKLTADTQRTLKRIKYALFEPPLERRIVVAGTMLVRETILGPANQGNGSAFGALRDEYDLRGCRPRRSALNGCDLAELNRRRFVQNGLADRVRVDGAGRKIVYLLIDFPHHMARERTQMQVQRQQRNDRSRRLRIAGHASLKCRPENRARLRHVGDDPLHHVDVAKPAVIGVVGADPALAVAVVEQAE